MVEEQAEAPVMVFPYVDLGVGVGARFLESSWKEDLELREHSFSVPYGHGCSLFFHLCGSHLVSSSHVPRLR